MKSQLNDPFNRTIEYLRLSVTDRCDLRCSYCMPKGFKDFETPENWLTFDEISRVIGAFGELGVKRIRLTGGEPLVRKGVADLSKQLIQLPGIEDLSLSTNAVQLERFAQPLFDAGVARLNVSLDTLNPEKFKEITGGGKLDKVIKGLIKAKAVGFKPIKLNMVALKGINDDEIFDMVDFCREHGFTLRFIETMPMGDTGRNSPDQFMSVDEIKAQLTERYELIPGFVPGGGPANYMQIVGSDIKLGFITPITQHFCETCNRVRLSVDGTLYMCLGQDHSFELRPLLRQGISDEGLKEAIIEAIALKPLKHEFNENPEKVVRFMSSTGG
ncbi:MAG: GTP 3',8-cyclase MoaA [Chromatiales bacterium]|nr:GTP 3',8-cyclase MoaA [Chromatiales bacterium]